VAGQHQGSKDGCGGAAQKLSSQHQAAAVDLIRHHAAEGHQQLRQGTKSRDQADAKGGVGKGGDQPGLRQLLQAVAAVGGAHAGPEPAEAGPPQLAGRSAGRGDVAGDRGCSTPAGSGLHPELVVNDCTG